MTSINIFARITVIGALVFSFGCDVKSPTVKLYSFRNLEIKYPGDMKVSREQEFPEKSFISLFLSGKEDRKSGIELGISEFPNDFLATVPKEELAGEMGAMVEELEMKVFFIPGVTVVEKSDFQWTESPSGCEAFAFSKIEEENGEVSFVAFSVKVVGNYSVSSVSRSPDPSTLERYLNILESIVVLK